MTAPRQPRSRRRPLRYALAAIGAIIGYYSSSYALAPALADDNVELAHRLAPRNAQISARLAFSLSGQDATELDRRRAETLALRALRQDATAVAAVTTLGITAELRGDRARGRRLFEYAQILSRRDLTSQLWAIESAVANNDIPGALMHYDIALRVSPEKAELLFPVLASASNGPAIRAPMIRMLAANTPWGEAFFSYLADKTSDSRAIAAFFLEARRAGATVPIAARISVIDTLARGGYADEAWKYYAAERPGVERRRSRDPLFTAAIDVPSQLDWVVVQSPGISTSIQRTERGGVFEYHAPRSVGGALLRQLQMLPPGAYRMSGHSTGIDQPEGERPYWLLTCHDGREFGRVDLPRSTEANGNFAGRMVVPAGCAIQMLQLVARAASAASGISGQIDRAQLEPDL